MNPHLIIWTRIGFFIWGYNVHAFLHPLIIVFSNFRTSSAVYDDSIRQGVTLQMCCEFGHVRWNSLGFNQLPPVCQIDTTAKQSSA